MAIREWWKGQKLWLRSGIIGFLLVSLGVMVLVTSSGMCTVLVDASSCSPLEALVWFPNILFALAWGVLGFSAGALMGFLVGLFGIRDLLLWGVSGGLAAWLLFVLLHTFISFPAGWVWSLGVPLFGAAICLLVRWRMRPATS